MVTKGHDLGEIVVWATEIEIGGNYNDCRSIISQHNQAKTFMGLIM